MNEQEFWAILNSIPEPAPVFYRLYYDELGHPVCYTMEDLPGKYIDIDQETYLLASHNVRVINNTLVKIKPKVIVQKLQSAFQFLLKAKNRSWPIQHLTVSARDV